MIITFANNKDESILHVEDTMRFEYLFEPALQLNLHEKETILEQGFGIWMFVDGQLAGETFGITPRSLYEWCDDEIPDTDKEDDCSIYCYTTNILKPFQGQYLAPVLMSYFQGFLTGKLHPRSVFSKIIGHTTTPRMKALRQMFGANFTGSTHKNWCESERTAEFYEQQL
jgi:hypothetical protein